MLRTLGLSSDVRAIDRLSSCHSMLPREDGRLVRWSSDSASTVGNFLSALEAAMRACKASTASRSYRAAFTTNYRTLLPNASLSYSADLLSASLEPSMIYVNGVKYEFSPEATASGERLQTALLDLGERLKAWPQGNARPQVGVFWRGDQRRNSIRESLAELDAAWAGFEQRYISDLIVIEESARSLVVESVALEQQLQALEARGADVGPESPLWAQVCEVRATLVACISNINASANWKRKGRDDLTVAILEAAEEALRRPDASAASRGLAGDVVESFAALRRYLRAVVIEKVDPHLGQNPGLVARLVDWEESWEVGALYVQHTPLLDAVGSLVAEVHATRLASPDLARMAEERDAELFLVLPRLLWISFLAAPMRHAEILRNLLPHRFPGALTSDGCGACEEVLDLLRRFSSQALPLRAFLLRAVGGVARGEDSTEDLLRELEQWSMELQRHCPEDWNQCCSVVVQCLSRESAEPPGFTGTVRL